MTTNIPARFRPAATNDLPAVLSLLAEAGLPRQGVVEALGGFLVAQSQGRVVGCVGVEGSGSSRLLRSVAVLPEWRRRGVGAGLVLRLLARVQAEGCRRVYLLTTGAAPFFTRLGFARTPRVAVPATVRESSEFRGACPDSATVMLLRLTERRERSTGKSSLQRDAHAVHRALSDLIRVYQFRDRDCVCRHGLTVTQCYALEGLVRKGPCTLRDLASHLHLDKSTTSRVAVELERKGHLARKTHPGDRRAVLLAATPGGWKLHATVEKEVVAEQMSLLDGFEPLLRRQIARFLARLAEKAEGRLAQATGNFADVGRRRRVSRVIARPSLRRSGSKRERLARGLRRQVTREIVRTESKGV